MSALFFAAKCVFFSFLFFVGSLVANESKNSFTILGARDRAGMFSSFNDVLSMLHNYERGLYQGVQVNFGMVGPYYDPAHGPNWWEYYCEPVFFGEKEGANIIHANGLALPKAMPRNQLRAYSRQAAYEIIHKYIHLLPHIQEKIDRFVNSHFTNTQTIIGVHYRGTDKSSEAPRVPYSEVESAVKKRLEEVKAVDCTIFIATDEENFLHFMKGAFPDKICYYEEATRSKSGAPLHFDSNAQNRYKCGEDAIIDCLLLSKTDLLIRTSSNLSLWSGYFNPAIPVITLNERYEL